MARQPHRGYSGTGNSAVHSNVGGSGHENISGEHGPDSHSSAPGGPVDMRPQPHMVRGTVGGVGKIAGPRLTGPNVGPINAPIYETEVAQGDSGEL